MNGKISSDIAPIIHFQKAPKVLKQIKEWDPETVLVGFKLESDVNKEELFERAKNRMEEAEGECNDCKFTTFFIFVRSNALRNWTRR